MSVGGVGGPGNTPGGFGENTSLDQDFKNFAGCFQGLVYPNSGLDIDTSTNSQNMQLFLCAMWGKPTDLNNYVQSHIISHLDGMIEFGKDILKDYGKGTFTKKEWGIYTMMQQGMISVFSQMKSDLTNALSNSDLLGFVHTVQNIGNFFYNSPEVNSQSFEGPDANVYSSAHDLLFASDMWGDFPNQNFFDLLMNP